MQEDAQGLEAGVTGAAAAKVLDELVVGAAVVVEGDVGVVVAAAFGEGGVRVEEAGVGDVDVSDRLVGVGEGAC